MLVLEFCANIETIFKLIACATIHKLEFYTKGYMLFLRLQWALERKIEQTIRLIVSIMINNHCQLTLSI